MAALRAQILENVEFLLGSDKTFQVITGVVYIFSRRTGENTPYIRCIVVEVNPADGTFQRHLIGGARQFLDDAMSSLLLKTASQIEKKLAQALQEDTAMENSDLVVKGLLGWRAV
ncbi:uncharacterized protein N7446_010584 [Penicillium canescens]|uniref:Uncharacterized protein n=1 Tax=Penicillium canescens TaxID=5083 RepID=A0AAD6N8H2_PENCN|nr:uncharacterized protein N7446_010584 [Penicillium canescens]KAJ6041533.1 hypothetical protein N7460_006923 [Penicillium canescens]KAJ6050475.1 hypothetical protein N7446_010584 [Penicillium canescens]KAJ6064777.1 hypothetical protein N7444_000430 [Penicillium canescens]